ncbi:MAG: hypothetical protein QOJ54_1336 [Aliidongia sp.]|nr:hypothetical protein [Aliidongia sp.]
MIRQPTLVALALCMTLGFTLFQVKYDVQSLEDQLIKIDRQAATDQEAIHVLKAEWSFLTKPARLAELSDRHLPLHPLTASQIGGFDQLALRADRPAAPQIAAADRDTPVESVLQAMQLAAYKPATPRAPGAAVKPRTVQ